MPLPLLFVEFDIFNVMEEQKRALANDLASAPESLSNLADDDVVRRFLEKFDIRIPVLQESGMTMTEREIDMDVSRDPNRMFFDNSGPFYVKGTEVNIHIPFLGESIFFRVRPSTFSLSPPRGLIDDHELRLQFTFPNDVPPPDLKPRLDRDISQIKQALESLESSAKQLRGQLGPIARQAWQQRKSEFANKGQLLSSLGLPRRAEVKSDLGPNVVGVDRPRVNAPARPKNEEKKEWHVFISHASEDKEAIAKPLAQALRKEGLEVWYDEYTLTVGDSLRRKIDEGLAKSKYGIVILSPSFFAKHWPQQELNGLAAKEQNGIKVILPVWHNVTQADVAAESPTLADRLAAQSKNGIDRVVEALLRAMKVPRT